MILFSKNNFFYNEEDGGEQFLTKHKDYEVKEETLEEYIIKDDLNDIHIFAKDTVNTFFYLSEDDFLIEETILYMELIRKIGKKHFIINDLKTLLNNI